MSRKTRIFGMDTNFEVDELYNFPITIDIAHNRVHAGNTYRTCKIFGTVSPNDSGRYFVYPSSKRLHMTITAAGEAKMYLELWKNVKATTTVGTTAVVHNMNDSSTNTNTASVYHTGAISTSGTKICEVLMPGGGNLKSHIGGEIRQDTEFVFGTTTTYMIRAINKITTSKDINVNIQWYEYEV